jgi:hypothetical protein
MRDGRDYARDGIVTANIDASSIPCTTHPPRHSLRASKSSDSAFPSVAGAP